MSVFEHDILMREVDEEGNMHINFPRTRTKCVEVGNSNLEEVLKNVAYFSSTQNDNDDTENEEEPEEISINADLLNGKSAEYFEGLVSDTTDKDWEGNPIPVERGGTELSAEDIKPNTILFVDENNKIKLLEPPDKNSILGFVDGKIQWISTISVDLEKPDTTE